MAIGMKNLKRDAARVIAARCGSAAVDSASGGGGAGGRVLVQALSSGQGGVCWCKRCLRDRGARLGASAGLAQALSSGRRSAAWRGRCCKQRLN